MIAEMLLDSKGNYPQNEKATYRMGGNICKLHIRSGVNIQNILLIAKQHLFLAYCKDMRGGTSLVVQWLRL